MAKVIGVYNRKGGQAKTETVSELASYMAMAGKRICVVDGDTQCDLTARFLGNDPEIFPDDVYDESNISTLYDVIQGDADASGVIRSRDFVVTRYVNLRRTVTSFSVHVLPGSRLLDELSLNDPLIMKNILDSIRDAYDAILIDFPPASSEFTDAYLIGCDHVLVPAEPNDKNALRGYVDVMNVVQSIIESGYNTDLSVLGLLYVKVMEHKKGQQEVLRESAIEKDALNLLDTHIRNDYTAVNDCAEANVPLCAGPGNARRGKAAQDYAKLANELIEKLSL